jgi:hypothetical protein
MSRRPGPLGREPHHRSARASGRAGSTLSSLSALLVLVILTACTGSTPEPVGYDPIPDSELFAEVQRLPGVREADVSYDDSFTNGPNYVARLRAERRADVADIIDSATAVLWQGRPDVTILVEVRREGSDLTVDSLTVGLPSRESLVERYGPQPGDGEVPPDAPPLPRPTLVP